MSLKAIATSAFGRRAVTRAQIEAQIAVDSARAAQGDEHAPGRPAPQDAVHKWTLLRALSEIREGLGVSDRTLGVLSALLSFHPETALTLAPDARDDETGEGGPLAAGARAGAYAGLVVFPSNRALSLRANGMSEATLRRHLSALVEAGLIIRRDSPNGKRFARRDGDAAVAQAFGFDLSPLVARAGEFEARLEALRAERRRARLIKERINLLRRDLSKRIAFALDEALPGPFEALRLRFLALCTPLRKLRSMDDFVSLAGDLDALQDAVGQALFAAFQHAAQGRAEAGKMMQKMNGDAAHFERRQTESNPDQFTDFEPDFQGSRGLDAETGCVDAAANETASTPDGVRELPLPLVLEACPDIADYAFGGAPPESWRSFVELATTVRPMLGVSPDAWREAIDVMGERQASAAIAFLLQRCEHSSEASRHVGEDGRVATSVNGSPAIRAPGGYLRALSQKARDGGAPLWSAILAHLAQRRKATPPPPSKPLAGRARR